MLLSHHYLNNNMKPLLQNWVCAPGSKFLVNTNSFASLQPQISISSERICISKMFKCLKSHHICFTYFVCQTFMSTYPQYWEYGWHWGLSAWCWEHKHIDQHQIIWDQSVSSPLRSCLLTPGSWSPAAPWMCLHWSLDHLWTMSQHFHLKFQISLLEKFELIRRY